MYLLLWLVTPAGSVASHWPLWVVLGLGGLPLVAELLSDVWRLEFGADLLAGISIITAVILGEYLAGALVVLMLSGGEALEAYAVRTASSVLRALAKQMPTVAHRQTDAGLVAVPLEQIAIGDTLLVLPHEICPVDGIVVAGHGVMDEAYLTGEPYKMSKSTGSEVYSGAINGEAALTIRATKLASDSRYAKIMRVMQDSESNRPQLRRLGDQLGAYYTPLALAIAGAAWAISGESIRFLAVLVTATPCPLLIAIPVAIISSISLAARRGIIIRDPAILEQIGQCRTMIFDKTGTLTYGEPRLTAQLVAPGFQADDVLRAAASLEQYSRHPLALPVVQAAQARGLKIEHADELREPPGQGLTGIVAGREIQVTHRKKLLALQPALAAQLPPVTGGLECVILINGQYAATYQFRDEPRAEGVSFVHHLGPKHNITKLMLVTGDRQSEADYLAQRVGIRDVLASQTPEQKLAIVREETARAKTLYLGDGVNDAPALLAATVGVAMGQKSEVTSEAAGAVILDNSLSKVDELIHIGHRMRTVALQSALGGMGLSLAAMGFAAMGLLSPVLGAVTQEVIDVFSILNALRVSAPPRKLTDYQAGAEGAAKLSSPPPTVAAN
ncbi:MAG: heavy metal translocating P-type ATPase [Pirellulales bacterium]|nr:heavy metal translocating P-type ATPase [Pirellulales bacterium]